MRFQGRRVYLTGATGFIGGAILRRLLAEGADVTCLVRPRTDASRLAQQGARVVRGDIVEPATLDMSGHDLAIHAAAWVGFGLPPQKLDLFRRTNVQGTENILHAAKRAGVGKVVHLSSVAALGAPETQPITEDTPRPDWFKSEYERTKTEAHALALKTGFPTALPMPGLVLGRGGPFDPIFRLLARGRLPFLPADDAVKGWVHVDDTAEGVLLAALKGTGPYILVDENLRLTELLVAALEEAGLPIPRRRIPVKGLVAAAKAIERGYHVFGRAPPVSEELLRSLPLPMTYDSARARKELGWRPSLIERLAQDLAIHAREAAR